MMNLHPCLCPRSADAWIAQNKAWPTACVAADGSVRPTHPSVYMVLGGWLVHREANIYLIQLLCFFLCAEVYKEDNFFPALYPVAQSVGQKLVGVSEP